MKKKHSNKIKNGNTTVTVILYVLAGLIALITVYPMYYVVIQSISDSKYTLAGNLYFYPKEITFHAYKLVMGDSGLWRAYGNTILYVIIITLLTLLTSICLAYGLCYKNLIGKKYLTMYLLIPMYFSGGLIPGFLLILNLGLYDSPWAIILTSSFSIWYSILVRSYFRTIPDSLAEAAKMDGAGLIQILTKIYIPMCKPIFAVVAVYAIIGVWNSWFSASVYLPSKDWQPLQMYLRRILVENEAKPTVGMSIDAAKEMAMKALTYAQLKYSMIVVTTLPVLVVYPFFQKYFVKGMVLGSLKD